MFILLHIISYHIHYQIISFPIFPHQNELNFKSTIYNGGRPQEAQSTIANEAEEQAVIMRGVNAEVEAMIAMLQQELQGLKSELNKASKQNQWRAHQSVATLCKNDGENCQYDYRPGLIRKNRFDHGNLIHWAISKYNYEGFSLSCYFPYFWMGTTSVL